MGPIFGVNLFDAAFTLELRISTSIIGENVVSTNLKWGEGFGKQLPLKLHNFLLNQNGRANAKSQRLVRTTQSYTQTFLNLSRKSTPEIKVQPQNTPTTVNSPDMPGWWSPSNAPRRDTGGGQNVHTYHAENIKK